jgi:hypothetical protein
VSGDPRDKRFYALRKRDRSQLTSVEVAELMAYCDKMIRQTTAANKARRSWGNLRSELEALQPNATVLELVRSAFPRATSKRAHADIVRTRGQLSLYRDEDFPEALGEVIEDAILSYPDTWDIDLTIRYLDAAGEIAGPYQARPRTQELVRLKSPTLEQLTAAQARAIVAWLNHISVWPELKIYRENIDAILPYWRARAERD